MDTDSNNGDDDNIASVSQCPPYVVAIYTYHSQLFVTYAPKKYMSIATQLQRKGGWKPADEDKVVTVKKKGKKGMKKGIANKNLDKPVIDQHTPKGSEIPNTYVCFTLSTHTFSSCSLLTKQLSLEVTFFQKIYMDIILWTGIRKFQKVQNLEVLTVYLSLLSHTYPFSHKQSNLPITSSSVNSVCTH